MIGTIRHVIPIIKGISSRFVFQGIVKFEHGFLFLAHKSSFPSMDYTPKIFISRPDIPESALQLLKDYTLEIWDRYAFIPRKTFLKKIADKDALFIYSGDKIDAEALDAAGPSLKVIATMSSGLDHIDVDEVKKRGIKLGSTAGVLEDAVAELAIGVLLAGIRKFFEGHEHIITGTWPAWAKWTWMNGTKIKGSVVGIIGFGRLGSAIANRLVAFKPAKILYVSRHLKEEGERIGAFHTPLNAVCSESDIIIVSLSLNAETKEILNEEKFNMMKQNAFLVNVSRGAIIDQNALVKALKEHKIAGAALDVMTPEPLPKDHELMSLKNLTLLPHIGSAEVSTRVRMAELVSENIIAGLNGKPLPGEVCY